ncbi:MAG TPA: polyhydroxyalkanoate depolymerase [Xanthomonadaceae bacterium]|nr:polyhydroxyalkanoate depolymerase [Xanthomonadaceae bacterium]
MLYQWHALWRAGMAPVASLAEAGAHAFSAPGSWLAAMPGAPGIAAGYALLHRLHKDYAKPAFDIGVVHAHGRDCAVLEEETLATPFCRLLRFRRHAEDARTLRRLGADPAVLVVAPLSGHHATLLRDTVRTLLRDHDVYVTDWTDARMVPADAGAFSLEDYVATLQRFIRALAPARPHVVAVCQATVPALAAVALLAARGEPTPPALVMMGGPVDARESPTAVCALATRRPLAWFEANLIHRVPAGYPGRGRRVYPGFLQHAGFVAMNPERHLQSHWAFCRDLARGEHAQADAHRRFYDEYNAVLDMPAEYYLDTVRIVFQQHLLARGVWEIAGERVDPAAIGDTALLTIEGELDDICGLGQTRAAHRLCTGLDQARKAHLTVPGAGHYGIFSGRRWREEVYPVVRAFIADHDHHRQRRSRRA